MNKNPSFLLAYIYIYHTYIRIRHGIYVMSRFLFLLISPSTHDLGGAGKVTRAASADSSTKPSRRIGADTVGEGRHEGDGWWSIYGHWSCEKYWKMLRMSLKFLLNWVNMTKKWYCFELGMHDGLWSMPVSVYWFASPNDNLNIRFVVPAELTLGCVLISPVARHVRRACFLFHHVKRSNKKIERLWNANYGGWLQNPASPKAWLKPLQITDVKHRFQLMIRISQPSTVCLKHITWVANVPCKIFTPLATVVLRLWLSMCPNSFEPANAVNWANKINWTILPLSIFGFINNWMRKGHKWGPIKTKAWYLQQFATTLDLFPNTALNTQTLWANCKKQKTLPSLLLSH